MEYRFGGLDSEGAVQTSERPSRCIIDRAEESGHMATTVGRFTIWTILALAALVVIALMLANK